MSDIVKWGDSQQYESAPMQADYDEATGVKPKVVLLSMTHDPLGAIAAACRMYEGKPTYSLADITDEERRHYWKQAQATHLKAPLEFVDFHFFIEGVDRAFTHQQVRQRTAVFAQESLRFAVIEEGLGERTSLPPSLHGTENTDGLQDGPGGRGWAQGGKQQWRDTWDTVLESIEKGYQALVNSGMPAEEARGLLPHAVATRLNYKTNLRNLLDHAGNRLCTQAQWHWRMVFAQMAEAIANYRWEQAKTSYEEQTGGHRDDIPISPQDLPDDWQFRELASVFRPVCYELGRCPFNASFDRACSIRDRVEAFANDNIPSSQWHDDSWMMARDNHLNVIKPEEWMLDPSAARA